MFEVNECQLIDTWNIYNQKQRQYGYLKKIEVGLAHVTQNFLTIKLIIINTILKTESVWPK